MRLNDWSPLSSGTGLHVPGRRRRSAGLTRFRYAHEHLCMRVTDRGNGPPLVFVPGIQGRWEYAEPAIDELARSFRVIAFSLCDEPASGCQCTPTLDTFASHLRAVLDEVSIDRAIICGVSFGGLVALRFSTLQPGRVQSLILVSTPGPGWRLNRRQRIYVRAPRLFGPAFLAEFPGRVRAEIHRALPSPRDRRRFAWRQLKTLARAPLSFPRMATRARLIEPSAIASDCARVAVPTLVIAGDPALDRIVAADGAAEFASPIKHATLERLHDTGHLGHITRPWAFAAAVRRFANEVDHHGRQVVASPGPDAA